MVWLRAAVAVSVVALAGALLFAQLPAEARLETAAPLEQRGAPRDEARPAVAPPPQVAPQAVAHLLEQGGADAGDSWAANTSEEEVDPEWFARVPSQ